MKGGYKSCGRVILMFQIHMGANRDWCFMYYAFIRKFHVWIKVKSMQLSGTEAIRTKIQPSKPKRERTNITICQNTKRTFGQPGEQLFTKRWPLSNLNRTESCMFGLKGCFSFHTGGWRYLRMYFARVILSYMSCSSSFNTRGHYENMSM